MKPNQFLQKHFLLCSLICAFGIAIIASCKKDYIRPSVQTENTAETETISAATGDTIPPTVSFTFPKNQDTVFDSITIKIKATDNVAVASVHPLKSTIRTMQRGWCILELPEASTVEQELLALINISPLTFNNAIFKAARAHSTDMATKNYLGHTGTDGSTLGSRLTKSGCSWTSAGECLAAGQTTAQAVFSGWRADPAKL